MLLPLIWAALTAASAQAVLLPNVSGDQSGTLPRGRFFLSLVHYFGDVGATYSTGRVAKDVRDQFRRGLGWKEIVEKAGSSDGPQLEGLLRANEVDLSQNAGQIGGDFRGSYLARVPVLGFGITDRIGLFAALPIIRLRAEMRADFQASASARSLDERLRTTGQGTTADEMSDRLNNGFTDRMNQLGYQHTESIDESMVGDLRLLFPIAAVTSDRLQVTLQPAVTVPTGRAPDASSLIPFSSGGGRWVAGVRGVSQWEFTPQWYLLGSAGMHLPLVARIAMRVPVSTDDDLPEGIDSSVRVSGGWLSEAQVDVKWQFMRSWSARLGMQSQHRFASSYSGSRFESSRYALMGPRSVESLQSLHASVEFLSIKAFLAGDFPMPFQVVGGVGLPLSGIGALADPAFMAQGSLFF